MISAEEARERTLITRKPYVEKEMKWIEKKIRQAVEAGLFGVDLRESLYNDNICKLTELGYRVNRFRYNEYGSTGYAIYWGKKNEEF